MIMEVPLGQELKVVGRVTSEGTRSFEGTGEILLQNGEIAVSAEGKYIKLNADKIANDQFVNEEWFLTESSDDPTEIEIPG